MATCNVQTLISTNPCLSAISDWMLELVEVQLLCNLKGLLTGGSPVTCDIQTLLDSAKCFNTLNAFALKVAKVQLLCDISNAIAAGAAGTASFLSGHGDPEGVAIGLTVGQTYADLDANTLWHFEGTPGTKIGWKP